MPQHHRKKLVYYLHNWVQPLCYLNPIPPQCLHNARQNTTLRRASDCVDFTLSSASKALVWSGHWTQLPIIQSWYWKFLDNNFVRASKFGNVLRIPGHRLTGSLYWWAFNDTNLYQAYNGKASLFIMAKTLYLDWVLVILLIFFLTAFMA